jgi:ribosomal protein S18 acetylase RimI-like enzyme
MGTSHHDGNTLHQDAQGAVLAGGFGSQGYAMLTWNSMAGNVTKLAVHPGSRRLGVGEALMGAALDILRKVKALLICTQLQRVWGSSCWSSDVCE